MLSQSLRHNLPTQTDALVGRAEEVEYLRHALLEQHRPLLTLIGPGGVGKTRLAISLAEQVLTAFDDGVWFVDLTGVPATEPDLVWLQTAQTLGLAEPTGGAVSAVSALKSALAHRATLLVLDNVEHVLDAMLPVAALLEACPDLHIVATSREPLRLRREYTYVVGPLALPDLDRDEPADALARVPAVALFIERVRAIDPEFTLDPETTRAIAELCIQLDGLPLAIELAATGTRLVTPRALLNRLTAQPSVLASRLRDVPLRHRTLWSTIAWSFDLLSPAERQLFRHLGIFAGPCTLPAVAAVLPEPTDEFELLDQLASLLNKSLLRPDHAADGEPGFRMLHTLREFALAQLREHGEYDQAAARHAAYFLAFAEQAEPRLLGADQQTWLARVQREHDNLRAALRASAERGDADTALRLSGSLWRFWWVRGHLHEGTHWLRQALALPAEAPEAARAKALHAAGKLARERGDPVEAEGLCQTSLALFRDLADDAGIALVLNTLGNIVGDRGDYTAARRLYGQSLALRRQLGDTVGTALALHNLSAVARSDGQLDEAATLGGESLDLFQSSGDRWGVGIGLANLARIALLNGEPSGAEVLARESLQVRQSLGDRQGTVRCLEILGQIAATRADFERATRLLSAVDRLREAIGLHRPQDEQADHEEHLARARAQLDPRQFALAVTEGQAMSLEATVSYAGAILAAFVSQPSPSPPRAPDSRLSPRELEVAVLVAEGMTNRQIAERLVISKWTADNHVANILRKLDLSARAQVASWVARSK